MRWSRIFLAALLALAASARAEDPDGPIRFVVPFAANAPPDGCTILFGGDTATSGAPVQPD